MTTFFCFSDESGDYGKTMKRKELKEHHSYIRSNIIIRSDEWLKLNSLFRDLKKEYGLPQNKEFKYSDLYEVFKWEKYGNELPPKLEFLKEHSYKILTEFVEKSISLLYELEYKEVFISYTINKKINQFETPQLFKFHLQELMQRLQMECGKGNNLGLVFFDSLDKKRRELFSDIYHHLYRTGDHVEYTNIKDCLNFENSHQSVGIQIADFISGTFSSIVRTKTSGRLTVCGSIFLNKIYPILRFNPKNREIMGYGLREIPRDKTVRGEFKQLILSRLVGF